MEVVNLRLRLTGNREDRLENEVEWRMIREDLTEMLLEGKAAGLKVTTMARYAGIHRKTAHALLREATGALARGEHAERWPDD
ncbi:MAG: hypothetical protein WKF96_24425 [Solirubrobacteraceae bacterium]